MTRRFVCAVAVMCLGCSDSSDVVIWQDIEITTAEGQPAGEMLFAGRDGGITLQLAWLPADIDPESLERDILPVTEWRVLGKVTDEDGSPTETFSGAEFGSYNSLGWVGDGVHPLVVTEVTWLSPAPPEIEEPGWEYRWARLELPHKAGNYHISVTIYPTADPEYVSTAYVDHSDPENPVIRGEFPEMGPGFTVYEGMVQVSEEVAASEPSDVMRMIVTDEEQTTFRERLEPLSLQ